MPNAFLVGYGLDYNESVSYTHLDVYKRQGIGRGADTLTESEQWARQALDMALGRGGDQVAVKKKNDAYDFFGGLSKGVEKRDKVRTRVIAASISDHMKASDIVLIMGHQFSDLDAVGSAVGMWLSLIHIFTIPFS